MQKTKRLLAIEKIISEEIISSHEVLLKKAKIKRHNMQPGDIITQPQGARRCQNTRRQGKLQIFPS